jgi:AbrB family looped-hinge helix DNA binding protein
MNATIYGRGQMVIPARARKEARITTGDVLSVHTEGDGKILLVRLERPKSAPKARVKVTARKGSHSVASFGRSITSAQLRQLLNDL